MQDNSSREMKDTATAPEDCGRLVCSGAGIRVRGGRAVPLGAGPPNRQATRFRAAGRRPPPVTPGRAGPAPGDCPRAVTWCRQPGMGRRDTLLIDQITPTDGGVAGATVGALCHGVRAARPGAWAGPRAAILPDGSAGTGDTAQVLVTGDVSQANASARALGLMPGMPRVQAPGRLPAA